MSGNKHFKAVKAHFGPKYDSDKDLPEAERRRIERLSGDAADKAREEAWKKQGLFPRLKSSLKAVYHGDKAEKK